MREGLRAERGEFMGRPCVRLGNGEVRATIDLYGGMVPQFGLEAPGGLVNAHWIPPFREASGRAWDESRDRAYWKAPLLHGIAGDFPCSPNFGPDCRVDGLDLPPHGWTANAAWDLVGTGVDEAGAYAYADFRLESPDQGMPLSWTRRDFMVPGQGVLYSSMAIANKGRADIEINLARHNTLGGDFLRPGCRISLCADRFMTAPRGTEFDDTGRLAQGAEFTSLKSVPLRAGASVDLSLVPGMIGYTDFVTGAVPAGSSLGWSCASSPDLGLAYLCLFPGPGGVPEDEIALSFNDLWMQYGGRRFTPWAEAEGGPDRTFCLGTENAVGAYANGLAYARANPSLLGRPTLVRIPAQASRVLHYATALLRLEGPMQASGIEEARAEDGGLALRGGGSGKRYAISADFGLSRRVFRDFGKGGAPC